MKEWNAIAAGDLSKRLHRKVSEIAGVLLDRGEIVATPGLLDGKAGIALFLCHYAAYSGESTCTDRAFDLFSEIFALVENGFDYPGFATGLAGIGWCVEHVVQSGFFSADTEELLSEVDPYLQQAMIADMQEGKYNYMYNALGIALYFLRRRSGVDLATRLAPVVSALEMHAEAKGKGSRWMCLDPKSGQPIYDLSLSRGSASIIAILAKLHGRRVATGPVERMMTQAVAYLLEQERDVKKHPTHFPTLVRDDKPIVHNRLEWCYGVTGIAMALWNAAAATGNRDWQNKAREVLRHSTTQRDAKLVAGIVGKNDQEGMLDCGISHGSAGLAQIYNRIYQATGLEIFREASLYWLEKTLDLATFTDGYAGFKSWASNVTIPWIPDASFLNGVAGIGLVILAALSATAPDWDEALLLS